MKIFLASDHGGFELKNSLRRHLLASGFDVVDKGPYQFVEDDDYPDYVIPTMKEMENTPYSRAILICKNGVGVCIAANKFKHIRAGLSWDPEHAKTAKIDDHINVLTLPAIFITDAQAKEVVDAWLKAEYSNEDRHLRRLKKVEEL